MKKIFLIAVMLSAVFLVDAQKVFINKNADGKIVRKVTTTNATVTKIDSLIISANEVGIVRVRVSGFAADSSAAVTGVRTYRYTKVAGTLTLSAATETEATVADTKVSATSFAAVSNGNNIVVRVTGKASIVMYWDAVVQVFGVRRDQ